VAERSLDQQRELVVTLTTEFPALSQRRICELVQANRSAIRYQHREVDDARLRAAILKLHTQWPRYGYRRLCHQLRREGWTINAKRVLRVMRDLDLLAAPAKRRIRTTNSQHAFPRYENLVKTLEMEAPNQVWVADITYVSLQREHVYLAIVMDVFTRVIRGWQLSRFIDEQLTLDALNRALRKGMPTIHHSDQGVQYASTAYVNRLKSKSARISMAAVGEPRENGYAERLMRTVKEEEVSLKEYRDYADATRNLGRFIDRVYNVKRIHSSLGYLTPNEYEEKWRREQTQGKVPTPRTKERATVGTDPSSGRGPNRS
jgi:putative transposase